MKNKVVINGFNEFQEYLRAFLYFFDEFCRKNNIQYTVLAGTMLGTIRGKGLIPWDGDIDVALTRKELEKLKQAFKHYHGRYHLNYPGNFYRKRSSEEQHPFYCRIIDKKCPCPYFLIDVYTIDYLGDDYDEAVNGVEELKNMDNKLIYGSMFHLPKIEKEKGLKRNAMALISHIFHPVLYPISWILSPILFKKIAKIEEKYFSYDENSKYEITEATFGRYHVSENQLMAKGISDYPFNNFKVMCINNYDPYLKAVYKDYMSLPPEDKRIPYPKCLLDTKYTIGYDEELEYYLKQIDSFLLNK